MKRFSAKQVNSKWHKSLSTREKTHVTLTPKYYQYNYKRTKIHIFLQYIPEDLRFEPAWLLGDGEENGAGSSVTAMSIAVFSLTLYNFEEQLLSVTAYTLIYTIDNDIIITCDT